MSPEVYLLATVFSGPIKQVSVDYIISLGGRPFHPSVPSSVSSSIHPSSSSRKKKMMGDFTVSEGHGYPLVQLKLGLQTRRETTTNKPPGPIIMIHQSETGSSS